MRGTWQTTGSGGEGGLVLAVIAAAVLIGSGAASTIASALVTILLITGCTIAAAVTGGIAWLVYRARQDRRGGGIEARPVYRLPPGIHLPVTDPSRPAIEPGREIHLHLNVTPDQLAAILRDHTKEES
jgi:hypothetical protein